MKRISYGLPIAIEEMILHGSSIANCKKALKEYSEYKDKSPKELQEILITASTYLFAERSAREFEKDFEYYRISPVMDDKTCQHCKDISKKIFKFSERESGVNFPPFHNGCRCTFTVEVGDWDKWMNDYVNNHDKSDNSSKASNTIYFDKIIFLCTIFGGWFGLHRYMRGQIGLGIIYTLTMGLFCIGWIVDIIVEATRPQK